MSDPNKSAIRSYIEQHSTTFTVGGKTLLNEIPATLPATESGNPDTPIECDPERLATIVLGYATALAAVRFVVRPAPGSLPTPPDGLAAKEAEAIRELVWLGRCSRINQRLYDEGSGVGSAPPYDKVPIQEPGNLDCLLDSQGAVFFLNLETESSREEMRPLLKECYRLGYDSGNFGKVVNIHSVFRSPPQYELIE